MSASVFEKTKKRALDAGFNDFLMKPFQSKHLLELLQKHLHLEWIYEDTQQKTDVDVQVTTEPSQIVPLPPTETANLLELARLGITRQILSALDEIEQQDTKYTPFVNVLRQLARNYQFNRLIELLEQRSKEE